MHKRDTAIGVACAIGCEVVYGASFVFTRHATGGASALALLGWRFLLALAVMTAFAALGVVKTDLKRKPKRPLIGIVLFSPVLYYIGETFGIASTSASESGIFIACIPVTCLIASSLLLGKRPTRFQVAGILVTLAGVVATVLSASASPGFSPAGYAFLALAVVSYSIYSVRVEREEGYTGVEVTYGMLVAGAAVFVPLALGEAAASGGLAALATLPASDPGFLAAVLYLSIGCSILAFFMAATSIAKLGVNRAATFVGLSTVVTVACGALFLHEQLGAWQIAAAVVIIAGVCIANTRAGG